MREFKPAISSARSTVNRSKMRTISFKRLSRPRIRIISFSSSNAAKTTCSPPSRRSKHKITPREPLRLLAERFSPFSEYTHEKKDDFCSRSMGSAAAVLEIRGARQGLAAASRKHRFDSHHGIRDRFVQPVVQRFLQRAA